MRWLNMLASLFARPKGQRVRRYKLSWKSSSRSLPRNTRTCARTTRTLDAIYAAAGVPRASDALSTSRSKRAGFIDEFLLCLLIIAVCIGSCIAFINHVSR